MKHFVLMLLLFPCVVTAKVTDEIKDILMDRNWDLSIQLLQQPQYQNDPEALFLLASAMRLKSHPLGVDAGPILLKAAELGSPWAMWSLAQKNNCKWYGWPCGDTDWKEKAAKRFKELAAQGDAQAVYFASDLRAYWQRYIPFYANVFQKEKVLEAQKLGYHRAARMYIEHTVDDDAEGEEREEAINILKYSSDKGYGPATFLIADKFYKKSDPKKAKEFYLKAMEQGFVMSATKLGLMHYTGKPNHHIEPGQFPDIERSFFYFYVVKNAGHQKFGSGDFATEIEGSNLLSKEKIQVLKEEANRFSQNHPPKYYFDMFRYVF